MLPVDYVYKVPELQDGWNRIQCINNQKKTDYYFLFKYQIEGAFVNEPPEKASIAFDLLDIGTLIYVIDWKSKRVRDESCHIHLSIPVRNPDVFLERSAYNHLCETLYWFTGDYWSFDFPSRSGSKRSFRI